MKTHLFSIEPEKGMPHWMRSDYAEEGLRGTRCGYMSKTTNNPQEVTCKRCLREMSKEKQ